MVQTFTHDPPTTPVLDCLSQAYPSPKPLTRDCKPESETEDQLNHSRRASAIQALGSNVRRWTVIDQTSELARIRVDIESPY